MSQTQQTFTQVLDAYPYLTAAGFDPHNGKYRGISQGRKNFDMSREILVDQHAIVGRVTMILGKIFLAPTLNYDHTSYGYKHLFEEILGEYISNGACITAAFMSGVRVKRCDASHASAYFNLHESDLELLEEYVEIHSDDDRQSFSEQDLIAKLRRSEYPQPKRRSISNKLRFMVLRRDNYRCQLCGTAAKDGPHVRLEVDHIIPRAHGGTDAPANLHTLCFECNNGKGTQDLWL